MNIDYFEYLKMKSELVWLRLYEYYVREQHHNVDQEAIEYADENE